MIIRVQYKTVLDYNERNSRSLETDSKPTMNRYNVRTWWRRDELQEIGKSQKPFGIGTDYDLVTGLHKSLSKMLSEYVGAAASREVG
jgi:hypothetical protein